MVIEETKVLHIHFEDIYQKDAGKGYTVGYIFIYPPLTIQAFRDSEIAAGILPLLARDGRIIQL